MTTKRAASIMVTTQKNKGDKRLTSGHLHVPLTLYLLTPPHGSSMPESIEEHALNACRTVSSSCSEDSVVRLQRAAAVSVQP